MKRRILLADDSVTIQKVIELTFMDEDYEVRAVSNGDEAVKLLAEMKPDFVIADVHMPGANGYEVCRRSKAIGPDVPVLLLVGTFEPFDEGAGPRRRRGFAPQEAVRLAGAAAAGRGADRREARRRGPGRSHAHRRGGLGGPAGAAAAVRVDGALHARSGPPPPRARDSGLDVQPHGAGFRRRAVEHRSGAGDGLAPAVRGAGLGSFRGALLGELRAGAGARVPGVRRATPGAGGRGAVRPRALLLPGAGPRLSGPGRAGLLDGGERALLRVRDDVFGAPAELSFDESPPQDRYIPDEPAAIYVETPAVPAWQTPPVEPELRWSEKEAFVAVPADPPLAEPEPAYPPAAGQPAYEPAPARRRPRRSSRRQRQRAPLGRRRRPRRPPGGGAARRPRRAGRGLGGDPGLAEVIIRDRLRELESQVE